MKKQVAVIFGSINSEHDISVASATSVVEHFPHEVFDLVMIYINKEGQWFHGNYSIEAMHALDLKDHRALHLKFDKENPGFVYADNHEDLGIDAAFIMLHGQTGEGGYIQGLLHLANIPFTGCDVLSAALCMDKVFTHQVCESVGIPMAKYQLVSSYEDVNHDIITYPLIVKPAREGSSFGVSYVASRSELKEAIEFAGSFDERVLIEEFIKGVEVGMGIFKTQKEMVVSEVDQVNVSGDFFNFQEKYHPHATVTLPVSTHSEAVRRKVQEYGKLAFDVLDCRHFARLDFFVTEDERIFLNEVNTIPGFTATSRYPSMLDRAGIPFQQLIQRMVEDVL